VSRARSCRNRAEGVAEVFATLLIVVAGLTAIAAVGVWVKTEDMASRCWTPERSLNMSAQDAELLGNVPNAKTGNSVQLARTLGAAI
jgi:hypothetical protein